MIWTCRGRRIRRRKKRWTCCRGRGSGTRIGALCRRAPSAGCACSAAVRWDGSASPDAVSQAAGQAASAAAATVDRADGPHRRSRMAGVPEWGLYIWLSAVLGGRCGEVVALRWADIDPTSEMVRLDENYVRTADGIQSAPAHQGWLSSLLLCGMSVLVVDGFDVSILGVGPCPDTERWSRSPLHAGAARAIRVRRYAWASVGVTANSSIVAYDRSSSFRADTTNSSRALDVRILELFQSSMVKRRASPS